MKRKELKLKVKDELKSLAKEIREMKGERKKVAYGYVYGLEYASDEYRRKHTAYCIYFNGTPYEAIESNPRYPLTKGSYNHFMDKWEELIDDAKNVCISS